MLKSEKGGEQVTKNKFVLCRGILARQGASLEMFA